MRDRAGRVVDLVIIEEVAVLEYRSKSQVCTLCVYSEFSLELLNISFLIIEYWKFRDARCWLTLLVY